MWFDQPKRGDHNVKGANQVLARIQGLFPKVTRTTIYSATAKKSVPALKGIGFVATRPSSDPVPTQYPPQQTVTQQDFRPTRPSFSNFEQNQEILEEAETETNIENLADNFVPKTIEPAFTGSGGSESLDINVSICGTGAETGSSDAETGSGDAETESGGIEKPIAPSAPFVEPTEPTAQSVPPIAPPESVTELPAPMASEEREPKLDADLVLQIADSLRFAISVQDAVAVREIARKSINLDKTGRLHAAVKNCLTPEENEACRILANPKQSQPEPIARDFAKRIREAISYQSPAVASAIERELSEAIDADVLTEADVVAVVGDVQFGEFKRLVARRGDPGVAP